MNLAAKEMTFASLSGMYVAEICSQVLVEAYQRLGITVNILQFPAKRSLSVSNSGVVDGEVVRIKGAEKNYPNLVRVKSQICSTESRVYVKNKKFKLEGWHSLQPYKIGIIRGHLYAVNGTQGMDVVTVKSNELLFKMLARDRIDVAIAQTADALYAISTLKSQGIEGLEPIVLSMQLYHYLNKKNIDLVPKIERVIDDMANEGRLAEIQDDFIAELKKQAAITSVDIYGDLSK
jgi:hypothetical protein